MILIFFGFYSKAETWKIDDSKSYIYFKGKYVGEEFSGNFSQWQAKINFDPSALDKSKIEVKIDLLSVETNNQSYAKTLSENDWFNSKKEQFAFFSSVKVIKKQDDIYHFIGDLEIKGIKRSIEFDSQIKFKGEEAEASADFVIDRIDWEVGKISDNSGAWVDRNVNIAFKIVASKGGYF